MSAPHQIAQTAERSGFALATGGGAWAWFAENAQAIGAVCALAGLLIAAAGFAVSWYYLHKKSKEPPA